MLKVRENSKKGSEFKRYVLYVSAKFCLKNDYLEVADQLQGNLFLSKQCALLSSKSSRMPCFYSKFSNVHPPYYNLSIPTLMKLMLLLAYYINRLVWADQLVNSVKICCRHRNSNPRPTNMRVSRMEIFTKSEGVKQAFRMNDELSWREIDRKFDERWILGVEPINQGCGVEELTGIISSSPNLWFPRPDFRG